MKRDAPDRYLRGVNFLKTKKNYWKLVFLS